MIFLVSQILIYLILSAVIGFVVGWLSNVFRSRHRLDELRASLINDANAARAVMNRTASEQEGLEARISELAQQLDQSEGRRELQLAEIASLKRDLSHFEDKDAAIRKYRNESDALRQQLRSAKEASTGYRTQLEHKARETAEYRLRAEKAKQDVIRLEKELGRYRTSLGDSESRASALDELRQVVDEKNQEVDELASQVSALDALNKELKEQAEFAPSRSKALEAQLRDAKDSQSRRQQDEFSVDHPYVSETERHLRKRLDDRTREYALLKTDYESLRTRIVSLEADEDDDAVVSEQEEVRVYEAPALLLDAPDGSPDDLTQIFGIGPVLEQTLNSLGIYHFDQIARLTEDEVRWLASSMDYFPKRIMRDDWVGQAHKLSAESVN